MFTVQYMGWRGLKNGRLLRTAEEEGVDILLTGDQTLYAEQNLRAFRIAVIVVTSIEEEPLVEHLVEIQRALDDATPGSLTFVDCGAFRRKKEASGNGV